MNWKTRPEPSFALLSCSTKFTSGDITRKHICLTAGGNAFQTRSWQLLPSVTSLKRKKEKKMLDLDISPSQWYSDSGFLTLSLSFSFSLSMDLFSPSSSRSISLTVSPDRVLNFFLKQQQVQREPAGSWWTLYTRDHRETDPSEFRFEREKLPELSRRYENVWFFFLLATNY